MEEALANESGTAVEHHTTGFGTILVAKLVEPFYLAFALASAWPMPVLEVHRMDRSNGLTETVESPAALTALDVPGVIAVFRDADGQTRGPRHVDR